MNELIGTVTAERIVGRLYTISHWIVTVNGEVNEEAGRVWASLYGTGQEDGPADGRPGAIALNRAAQDLGGTLVMTPDSELDPDVEY
jgi:hypothetical protein